MSQLSDHKSMEHNVAQSVEVSVTGSTTLPSQIFSFLENIKAIFRNPKVMSDLVWIYNCDSYNFGELNKVAW